MKYLVGLLNLSKQVLTVTAAKTQCDFSHVVKGNDAINVSRT